MKQFILQPEETFLYMISELEDELEVQKQRTRAMELCKSLLPSTAASC